MAKGFQYRKPTTSDIDKRANQSLGSFEGYLKDDYPKYTAKKGENAIRILPRHADEQAPYYGEEVYVHYNVGPDKASVLCAQKMAGEPCPICEERARAERRHDEEAASEMKPNRRVIMWIVDRKEESKGPQVYDCPPTVDRDIAKASKDRETGTFQAIDDPYQGWDIYFDRDGEGLQTKYSGYSMAKRQTSVEDRWLDYITNNPLLDTLRIRSYDEVKVLFEGGSVGKGSKPDRPSEDERPKENSSRPSLNRGNDSGRSDSDRPQESERASEPERNRDDRPREEDRQASSREEDKPPFDTDDKPKEVASEQTSSVKSGADRAREIRERFAARGKA
jgi:gp32 DNA binding protein like